MRKMKTNDMGNQSSLLITICLAVFLQVALFSTVVKAESDQVYELKSNSYEVQQKNVFDIAEEYMVHTFAYGEETLGVLSLTGDVERVTTFSDVPTYISDSVLEIHYTYGGELRSGSAEDWKLCLAETKKIGDITLKKNISEGALIIQKSKDGKTWENATDPYFDFLKKEKDNLIVYEINDQERYAGTYYRIILSYEVEARIEKNADFSIAGHNLPINLPMINNDEYDHRCCSQVYMFYVCPGENPVVLRDVVSGADVSAAEIVSNGFQIDKRGSSAEVNVTCNGNTVNNVSSYESYYQPGDYTVSITTPLGAAYEYNIYVEEGMEFETIMPTVYENEKKKGYGEAGKIEGKTSTGVEAYSVLKLGHDRNASCVKGKYHDVSAYGVTGDTVCFFLSLDQKRQMRENGWVVRSDSWGSKKNEKIYGVSTGRVDSGALIVQTSADGRKWINQENLGYAQGLYNTDFEANYGDGRDVLIYTPDGKDVLDGIFIRIAYVYLAQGTEKEKEYRYVENYTFFLCSNELGGVTVHNLSANKILSAALTDEADILTEIYTRSETMMTGSCTVSGFTVDKGLNEMAEYTVAKDGKPLNVIGNEEYVDTGRYDIVVKNFFGTKEIRTIYVDRYNSKKSYKLYFGDSLLSGKRIFSEGKYPVYEGGEVQYHLNEVSSSFLPLGGKITNLSTGEVIEVESSREERTGTLYTPGLYEAVFTNDPFTGSEEKSGDQRTFTFHFELVASGNAPGPAMNQKKLSEYNSLNVSGCRPHAYALIYQSASKGNIALIFASKQEAYEFAAQYESGIVEKQKDGSYRYTGSLFVSKKTKYESNWDLNDAIDYFAKLAVQDWYFDMSDEYTYLTLSESNLDSVDNLRTLELDKSIAIFASEETRAELSDIDALPFINGLTYAYLKPGQEGEVKRGKHHFEFIKDDNEWDSSKVSIIDVDGNEYPIAYNKNVGEQLKAAQCAPGIVTVCEENVYGDKSEYRAVYLTENKNLSKISLSYYQEGTNETKDLSQKNDELEITADSFTITSIEDETDPYSLVAVVRDNLDTEYYTAEEIIGKTWTEAGNYQVKFINRLGYFYSVFIRIENGNETSIAFAGDGTEELQSFTVTFGDHDIQLPTLERYGYDFGGYRDSYGNIYTDEIAQVLYKGTLVLETVWTPKTVNITLEKPDGTAYQTDTAAFGSEYRIGSYITENKNEHVNGWLYDGQLYTDTILIDQEEDYVLRVSVDEIGDEEPPTELHEERNKGAEEQETQEARVPNKGNVENKTTEAAEEPENQKTGESKGIGRILGIWVVALLLIGLTVFLRKRTGKSD